MPYFNPQMSTLPKIHQSSPMPLLKKILFTVQPLVEANDMSQSKAELAQDSKSISIHQTSQSIYLPSLQIPIKNLFSIHNSVWKV